MLFNSGFIWITTCQILVENSFNQLHDLLYILILELPLCVILSIHSCIWITSFNILVFLVYGLPVIHSAFGFPFVRYSNLTELSLDYIFQVK